MSPSNYDEYRVTVIGDEPAGLWLLREYEKALVEQEVLPKMAWISLNRNVEPVPMPVPAAQYYQLPIEQRWSAELLSPERSLVWSRENVAAAFPELELKAPDVSAPKFDPHHATTLQAVQKALRARPELLTFASGIWKYFGRTHRLHAESIVRGALLCTDMGFWNPTAHVSPTVQRIAIAPDKNPIEEVQMHANGALALKFADSTTVVSHRWILNLNVHQLAQLAAKCPEFAKLVAVASDMRSRTALYSLRVRSEESGVPCPVRPLSVYFDTDAIPDMETETWPIQLHQRNHEKELVLWASAPAQASLEAILERFRAGMMRLNHLFPFLPSTLRELSVALDLDSCATAEARAETLAQLEATRQELYDLTAFQTATRHPSLVSLMPFVNCHLPYPLGPLHAARAILPAIVGKRKKPPAKPENASKSTSETRDAQ